jgi:16S rRNA (guanine1207-N2)-methyltransferase
VRWQVAGAAVTVVAHAGAFAAERLDPGTEVLLDALGRSGAPPACGPLVVDLGCGTGVVGTHVALADPDASVVFVDESFHAVASAEATFRASLGPDRQARFVVGDCLDTVHHGVPFDAGTVDRVIVNPPFHSGHALTDAIAWDMFVQARRALRRGGDVWVVGNRHLGYHVKLKRIFGAAEVMASTPGFVVLRAVRA